MNIVMVPSRYPSEEDKTKHVFVQKLAQALVDSNHQVTVIVPSSRNKAHYKQSFLSNTTGQSKVVNIEYYSSSISMLKRFLNPLLYRFFVHINVQKILRLIKKNKLKPDIIYGHFLYPSGVYSSIIGSILKIPAFVVYGESSLWSVNKVNHGWLKQKLCGIANKTILLEQNLFNSTQIKVVPNAINGDHYYKRSKEQSRYKFHLPIDKFIFSFVGQLIERKGIHVLMESLLSIDDAYIIIAGEGDISLQSNRILFLGKVCQEEMPFFLSASDAFVLPTRAEGCSNAILEAIGCELPIITSNLPFNHDILSADNAILINPYDKEEVISAMKRVMYDHQYRVYLEQKTKENRSTLLYEKRLSTILNLFNVEIENNR